jgi:predicted transcriptional regulator YheO
MPAPSWIAPYEPVVEAVVRLFHPHVEAVLHDTASDSVTRIWNPFSGRHPGEPSLLEPELLDELGAAGVVGPYEKAGVHGEQISSVSVAVAGGAGLLCFNFDRSVVAGAAAALRAFGAADTARRPVALFERDWQEQMNAFVRDWCRDAGLDQRRLSPADRLRLVTALDGKGAFQVRRAAAQLAVALDVSRATVYATLKRAWATDRDAAS